MEGREEGDAWRILFQLGKLPRKLTDRNATSSCSMMRRHAVHDYINDTSTQKIRAAPSYCVAYSKGNNIESSWKNGTEISKRIYRAIIWKASPGVSHYKQNSRTDDRATTSSLRI